MNALSQLQVLVEANPTQAPLGRGREEARLREVCQDEQTPPQGEDAFEGFIDGAGI
jgi:hypothetical protein